MFDDPLAAPPLIRAPDDPSKWDEWRQGLHDWREAAVKALGYRDDAYDDPAFAWMQTCRACGKVMMFDRTFVEPETGHFLVEDWVKHARDQFGELDALVLWQAYPRIGFDSRNQFDHYREVPGGLKGLKDVVNRLHQLDVKAILAYNPWDVGTRREPKADYATIAEMVGEVGFDGVFLDTLREAGRELRGSLDRSRKGVALISELALPLEAIADHHASWAQWFDDSHAPGILRNRWLERRHMMHQIRRWDTDHTGELHIAWMNGAGMFLWQNIFGSWSGWTDRDLSILRSMLPIQKHFSGVLTHGIWTPLVDCTLRDCFASKWELSGATLWTLVNRSHADVKGSALPEASHSGSKLYDLVRGIELDHADLEIPARGIGAVVRLPDHAVSASFKSLLEAQARRFRDRKPYATRVDPMPIRTPAPHAPGKASDSMVRVEGGRRAIISKVRIRECGDYVFMPQEVYPGLHGHRLIERRVTLRSFALDRSEVTNAEFLAFLKQSGYEPKRAGSFLAHWVESVPAPGTENHPVTFVDLNDARAYAKWAKKRLPTEDEWQSAVEDHGLPFGKVWNWTESEHADGHTTFSFLKGGCSLKVEGSDWYADGGARSAEWSAKFIHFYPELDRCETIGFRCAVDL